jgi:hypothetical protein
MVLKTPGVVSGGGNVRTIFVFTDLPVHLEFRAGELPLLGQGTVVEFSVVLKNPRDSRKSRHIEGPYKVHRAVLKYETGRPGLAGLTQYLEWKPVDS